MSSDSDVEIFDVCPKCFQIFDTSTHHVCKRADTTKKIDDIEVADLQRSVAQNSEESNNNLLASNALPLTENITTPVLKSAWTDENTSFMLECYHQYMEQIGPMKKFKNKKSMWVKIKHDIEDKFNYSFTDVQIENRYKTVLKRNKTSTKNNNTTGSSPNFSIVDDEFAKIASLDDSIEPAVQVGTSSSGLKRILKDVIIAPKDVPNASNKRVKTSVTDVLIAMHKEKEESKKQRELDREKRHNEKMDLLKAILNNK